MQRSKRRWVKKNKRSAGWTARLMRIPEPYMELAFFPISNRCDLTRGSLIACAASDWTRSRFQSPDSRLLAAERHSVRQVGHSERLKKASEYAPLKIV